MAYNPASRIYLINSDRNILDNLKTEFKLPKRELKLTTNLTYDSNSLEILSKVNINYPTVFFPSDENPLPIFGVSKFGEAKFPYGEWSLTLTESEYFKIIGIDISLRKEQVILNLREV